MAIHIELFRPLRKNYAKLYIICPTLCAFKNANLLFKLSGPKFESQLVIIKLVVWFTISRMTYYLILRWVIDVLRPIKQIFIRTIWIETQIRIIFLFVVFQLSAIWILSRSELQTPKREDLWIIYFPFYLLFSGINLNKISKSNIVFLSKSFDSWWSDFFASKRLNKKKNT